MGVITQINLLVRGRSRRVAEAIVDANGLEIAEQAIVEAEQAMSRAKHEQAGIMVRRRQLEKQVIRLREQAAEADRDGRAALAEGREDLARRLAEVMTRRKSEQEHVEASLEEVLDAERVTRNGLRGMADQLEHYRAEYSTLQSLDAAERARRLAGSDVFNTDAFAELDAVMQRVRGVKGQQRDRSEALREIDADLSGASLEADLESAGVGDRKSAVDAIMAGWQDAERARDQAASGQEGA